MKTLIYVTLTNSEMVSLNWAAARYDSADLLFENLKPKDKNYTGNETSLVYKIKKSTVRRVYRTIPKDGGSNKIGRMIPCIGGSLAGKIQSMFQESFDRE